MATELITVKPDVKQTSKPDVWVLNETNLNVITRVANPD
jgi:hypothetical protein